MAASLAGLLSGLSAPALAAPADVVISQYYGGAGSNGALWNKDFVELFNRSSAPVSLNGWSVQYQSATGSTWQAIALTNTVLQPGQYYLVTAQTASTGTDVGQGDATGGLALSATSGKVALASVARAMSTAEGEAVIDLVGFGTANRFEGSVAPAPSTANAIQRGELGCLDTDDNGSDFSAAPVVGPRRTSSPLNACAGGGGPVTYPIVLSCPAGVQVEFGRGTSAALSASDRDSIVNSAVIASGAVPGISITGFTPAGAAGGTANATLSIDPSLAAGNYPLTITFANNDGQDASCNVAVSVAGQLSIPQIQGPNPKSAYNNTVQTTQGVVTHKVGSGYFIQDQNGDGDPATSDGIFVFSSNTGVNVGDLVRITGTVTEYTPSGAT
ncbi:MAG TPA: endonuclease/exonuclease/phosphatase, partial [Massilia sp.]|nr:endonuclease/exonuclease/phosphatase [Massilia sp.]